MPGLQILRGAAVLILAAGPVAAQAVPGAWFTYSQNRTKCFASRSPADRVRDIQGSGHDARVERYGPREAPTKVEVIDDQGDGYETVYTYWRSQAECEAELPQNQPVDDDLE